MPKAEEYAAPEKETYSAGDPAFVLIHVLNN